MSDIVRERYGKALAPNGWLRAELPATLDAIMAVREKDVAELLARIENAEAELRHARYLVETALRMRMFGEEPPGGTGENWRDWDRVAEEHLRRALGGES